MIRYIRQRHIGVKESHRLLLFIAHGLFEYLEEVTLGQRITPCLKILLNSGAFSLITDQMFVVCTRGAQHQAYPRRTQSQ